MKQEIEKKYYEMDEVERAKYRKILGKKIWKITKKILLAIFCVALILLMGFALLGDLFEKPDEQTSQAIINMLLK